MEENIIIEENYLPSWCLENNYIFYYDTLNKIMMTFLIFLSGFSIAFSIVGLFIIDPLIKKDFKIIKKLEEDELVKKEEYEFLDNNISEFEDLSMNDLHDSYNKDFIEVKTPKGLVYMNYDKTLEVFNYYCNSKEIPYNYLQSVARSFVIKYNCKNIYIKENNHNTDERNENNTYEINENNTDHSNESKSDDKNNVFVKFKNLNNQKKSIKIPNDTKCNCFKYKGKIIDYEDNILNKKKDNNDEYIEVDYLAFKKNN